MKMKNIKKCSYQQYKEIMIKEIKKVDLKSINISKYFKTNK